MSCVYDVNAPKKPANLTVNSDLMAQAKNMKINVSATLEQALAAALKTRKTELWKEENKDAIGVYNETVEKYGLFSEGMRTF